MTREETEEKIEEYFRKDFCPKFHPSPFLLKTEASIIVSLFEEAGWKAPDACDPEKEALIRENFELKGKMEAAVDYLLSYSTKAFGKDYWQKMIDEKAREK